MLDIQRFDFFRFLQNEAVLRACSEPPPSETSEVDTGQISNVQLKTVRVSSEKGDRV